MASNFPAGTDNFTIPNSPGTTALSSAGTSARNHVQNHRDLGDAIEAMQPEATLLVHSHNGSTARHGSKLLQANTHQTVDTDLATTSLHHTLGAGALQAAPANHAGLPAFALTHTQVDPRPVGSIFMSTVAGNPSGAPHNLGGTWVQITDAFLIGAGGSYVAAATGGAATHTHSAPTAETKSDHTHTMGSSGAGGSHAHSVGGGSTGAADPSHSHSAGGPSNTFVNGSTVSGYFGSWGGHTHSWAGQSSSNHAHAMGNTNTQGDHTHTFSSSGAGGGHTHTVTVSTPSNLPPWLAVYTWKRTA